MYSIFFNIVAILSSLTSKARRKCLLKIPVFLSRAFDCHHFEKSASRRYVNGNDILYGISLFEGKVSKDWKMLEQLEEKHQDFLKINLEQRHVLKIKRYAYV